MRFHALALCLALNLMASSATYAQTQFPRGCPLFPIVHLAFGSLYYGDYFPTGCDDPPEACYLFGQFNWPCVCSSASCVSWNDELAMKSFQEAPARFPGLDAPILPTDTLKLAAGPARDYARVFVDPAIPFIEFEDVDRNTRQAKVFACAIDTRGAESNHAKYLNRIVYVALEATSVDKSNYVPVSCTALDPEPVAGKWQCYAYRGVYQPSVTQKYQILVLAAKKQPQPTLAKATE